MDIDMIEVAQRTLKPKAKSKNILGLMTEGKGENLIRDDQGVDLVQVREREMAQEHVEQVARAIGEHLLALGHPSQRPMPIREAMEVGEAKQTPGMYRLDADD